MRNLDDNACFIVVSNKIKQRSFPTLSFEGISMDILQVQPCVVPGNLRVELPDPHTPWQISKRVFSSLREPAPSAGYKKAQVLPEDKEWRFIWRYFHADKPTRHEIKRIWCVHERHQQQAFELHLSNQEREATKFPPTWEQEPRAEQRAAVIDRWTQATAPFSPFQYREADGRIRSWRQTKILPLWHGTREEICESICSSGFVYFGKTSLGTHGAGDPKSTDEGYFGSGFYFTNSPRYAADIYSKGHLHLVWVSMRHPFPVVGDPEQLDMAHLRGRGAYKHYNAHYVPVVPVKDNPHCAHYHPAQPGETPICDEYVVFEKVQTLPGYWIELEIAFPYLMVPSDAPQFVEQLIPHLKHFLQNPEVDKDLKLRRVLGQELGILLTLQNDDDLSDAQMDLYQRLTQLLIQGKIDKTARNIIVGLSPSQGSSSYSQSSLSGPQSSSPSQVPHFSAPLVQSAPDNLFDAAKKGDIETMKFLLEKDPQLIRRFRKDGATPLHYAAAGGNVEAMNLLLEIDPQLIGRFEKYGMTPLHAAAQTGQIEAGKYLLSKRPDLLNLKTKNGETPFLSARSQHQKDFQTWISSVGGM